MRQASEELRQISERLLSDAQEENRRRTAEYTQTVARMKEAADKQAEELAKLQRDYHDVVSHFQAELQQSSESKALAAGDNQRRHAADENRQGSIISANKSVHIILPL